MSGKNEIANQHRESTDPEVQALIGARDAVEAAWEAAAEHERETDRAHRDARARKTELETRAARLDDAISLLTGDPTVSVQRRVGARRRVTVDL